MTPAAGVCAVSWIGASNAELTLLQYAQVEWLLRRAYAGVIAGSAKDEVCLQGCTIRGRGTLNELLGEACAKPAREQWRVRSSTRRDA